MYDYMEAMKTDIREWIDENDFFTGRNVDYIEDDLVDALWNEDSVTGNVSGSYTFSTAKAKEYVLENTDLCREALTEFCQPMNGLVTRLDSTEYWDELVYNRKLTDEEVRCYDLEYIGGTDHGREEESGL